MLLAYFSPYLFHLNETLFAATGDGLKNFYTLSYYVKHDTGFSFTGMLYPYGEHPSFTDNQPLVAFVLRFIQRHLLDISPYLLGIANTLMFLNFFVCAFFLYKILRQLHLPGLYSAACAVFITLISPTSYRIIGHYSLSYSFLIPLTIYLIMQYEVATQGKQLRIAITICMVSFLSALLHPYWVIITAMMVVLYALVKTIYERAIPLKLLLAGLSSPLLFKIFFLLTDSVKDRPQDPWGAAEYAAWISTVFFPQFQAYAGLRNLFHIKQAGLEDLAYVGIPGILFLVFLAVRLVSGLIRRRRLHFLPGPLFLKYLFISGFLILLLAMFIPFRFGMEDVFYRIPFLNQFRSLGRFAWAFYFVFCIYYAYGFGVLLRRVSISRGTTKCIAATVVLFLLWFSDLHFTLSKTESDISHYGGPNVLIENNSVANLLETTKYKPSDFQALLPLPIVAIGSEKLALSGGWLTTQNMFPYSYQTGTPILGCMMSRTSISRTLNLIGVTGSRSAEKKIADDFKSDLPLLVLVKAKETNGFIFNSCRSVAHNDELYLYSLPVDSLKKYIKLGAGASEEIRLKYTHRDNYFTDNRKTNVFYHSYETMEANMLHSTAKLKTIDIEKFRTAINPPGARYALSCWIYITPVGNTVPYFRVREFDANNKQLREKSTGTDRINQYDVVNNWIRFEDTFNLSLSAKEVELEIIGQQSIVDHFMFRPEKTNVAVFPDSLSKKIFFNNFLITLQD